MGRVIAGLCILLLSPYGCSIAGPSAISRGRADYNQVINRTGDEQMLMHIVQNRYGETSGMLAVTSVTANVRIAGRADINVGIGPDDNYAGNLVPFSGGATYEENPTISYTPVQGERYIREMLSPVPLDLFVLMTRSVTRRDIPWIMLVSRINDIWNPHFIRDPEAGNDPRFTRFVELVTELEDSGSMLWAENPREGIEFSLVFRNYAPDYSEKVRELLTLLEQPVQMDMSEDIVLPILLAIHGKKFAGIAVTTRSVFELVQIMSASVDVPEEHARSGVAIRYPPKGLAAEDVHIRSSQRKPESASVAVKYRGSWFYIEDTDQRTKIVFRLVSAFWAVRIANAAVESQQAPVLTIPASR
jgi:hypothetical protein